MKNNVIAILIDSVLWECVANTRAKVSATPFLDSLRAESITASKLYSHGPYTDAATKSLYTGRNCLDDFGYFFRLNSAPSNHLKAFHDAGYETFSVYYPYYTVGQNIRESIDHKYYSAGFIYKSEWGGIFSYYAQIIKQRPLNDNEWVILEKRTELMFETWMAFYTDVIKYPEVSSFIYTTLKDVDVVGKQKILEREQKLFQSDKKTYILGILEQGINHTLAKLDDIDVDKDIDRNKLSTIVYSRYSSLFKRFSSINFRANVFKNAPSIKRLFWGGYRFLSTRNIDEVKFLANYFVCLRDIKKNREKSFGHWQDIPSARRHMKFAADLIKCHNSDKPFYLSLHILDPHNYVSFFSYDMLESDIIDEEMEVLKKYIDELGTDFVGSLAYFLSIRYVDFCIEKLCDDLKKQGIWDKTTLLFMADHGSSYSFYPLHGARVNCFDDECYHVPFMIRSPNLNGFEFKEYANSKDIYPTLFDVLGIRKPDSFIGHSMLSNTYPIKDYVMTEYMGPGCPDMLSRPIWFSIRDNHYIVAYKVGIYQNFEDGNLCEVYNLKLDPYGFYNINKKININEIQYLIEPLKRRFEEVRVNTYKYIEYLKKDLK